MIDENMMKNLSQETQEKIKQATSVVMERVKKRCSFWTCAI